MDQEQNDNISNQNQENNNIEENNIKEENPNKENKIISVDKNAENNNINVNINLNNIFPFSKKDKKEEKEKNPIEEKNNNNIININQEEEKEKEDNKNSNEEKKEQFLLDSEEKEEDNLNIQKEKEKISLEKSVEKFTNIPIYIYSAKSIYINNVPILIYFLRGKLVRKEILRTFNDFEAYYHALAAMWPCICVPCISFKQPTPSVNSVIRFPEIKTKLLNHFFKKLAESKQLLNCEATKIFLSQDKNFNMKLSNMKNENYKEISERYFKIFTDFVEDKKITDEKEHFIKKNCKLLEVTFKKWVDLGKTIENEIYNIKKEQNSLDFVTSMFLDLEKSMPNPNKYLTDIKTVAKPLKSVSNIYIIKKNFYYYSIILLNHILCFIPIF
jgi:hypothetical protein